METTNRKLFLAVNFCWHQKKRSIQNDYAEVIDLLFVCVVFLFSFPTYAIFAYCINQSGLVLCSSVPLLVIIILSIDTAIMFKC